MAVLPAVLLLAFGSLAAAEGEIRDVRLVAEARPLAFRQSWEDDGASIRHGDGAWDAAWAVGAGLRWGLGASGRPHRLVVGVEALYLREESGDLIGDGALLRAECGYGAVLTDRLVACLLPFAGGGALRLRRSGGIGGPATFDGLALEGGVRLGLRWSLDQRWSLVGEAGWLGWRQTADDGVGRLTLAGDGMWLAAGAVWTLDPDPRPLE